MRFFAFFLLFIFSQLHALTEVEELISQGSGHNNFLLYEDALKFLDRAIKIDPSAKEAFKERSLSYFELNRIDLALKDYYQIARSKPPYLGHTALQSLPIVNCSLSGGEPSKLDFARGLLHGSIQGGNDGTVDYVSSVRGGLTFLWSLACSPLDVSKELIDAFYEIGELIASGRISYLLEAVVPEIIECKNCWNTWSEYTKGQKMGFIVGKYSILVFYEITTFKGGVYFYNKLKRANIMAILERYSATKSAQILEESARHAKKNTAILKKAIAGSVVPHNPNVIHHTLTKKHNWDKFIKLTGNPQKDFEGLVAFLENENILQCPRTLDYNYGSVMTYKYTKEIGKDKVVALFEINKQNLPLLRNAWVEVGVPYVQ